MGRLFVVIIFFTFSQSYGQTDSTDQAKLSRRLPLLAVGTGVIVTGTLYALSNQWYDEHDRESFHFFNDTKEWKQVDKAGHLYGGYQLNNATYKMLQWSGLNKRKSLLWSGITSFAFMGTIEIMDGYSSGYGASVSDLIANSVGIGLFQGQMAGWGEIRIHPKFGFARTDYPGLRPDVLGSDMASELLKDYNGQTYWFSIDLSAFISGNFPDWLNLAVGYGAQDMVYARNKPNSEAGYDAYRQWYLGPDIDLTHIQSHSRFVRTVLYLVNMVRIPFPAIEFSRKGTHLVIQ